MLNYLELFVASSLKLNVIGIIANINSHETYTIKQCQELYIRCKCSYFLDLLY